MIGAGTDARCNLGDVDRREDVDLTLETLRMGLIGGLCNEGVEDEAA